jgi:hypothetical protein
VPKPVVDISVFGNKALERDLASFPPGVQKKVVRPVLRRSLKRLKAHVVRNLSGHPVSPDSGRYLAAMIAAKPHALKRSRTRIGVAFDMPPRTELGIPPGYKWYYPAAVEYGHPRASAKAPIRRAVNAHTNEELGAMGRDIGRGIEREAKKHFKKAVGAV